MQHKTDKLYNVQYFINKQLVETIAYNKPLPLAKWIKRTKESSTHSVGTIVIKLNS